VAKTPKSGDQMLPQEASQGSRPTGGTIQVGRL